MFDVQCNDTPYSKYMLTLLVLRMYKHPVFRVRNVLSKQHGQHRRFLMSELCLNMMSRYQQGITQMKYDWALLLHWNSIENFAPDCRTSRIRRPADIYSTTSEDWFEKIWCGDRSKERHWWAQTCQQAWLLCTYHRSYTNHRTHGAYACSVVHAVDTTQSIGSLISIPSPSEVNDPGVLKISNVFEQLLRTLPTKLRSPWTKLLYLR